MKCRLCERDAISDLCGRHQAARDQVLLAYPRWSRAYGGLVWEDYLDMVKRNRRTGQWAREVASMEGD